MSRFFSLAADAHVGTEKEVSISASLFHGPEANALPKSDILSAVPGHGKSPLNDVGLAQTRHSAAFWG